MSAFSEILSRFIDEKHIKVYSVIQYTGLDRSTMYQIINGKRTPASREIFQKIAEALHLTPLEYEDFSEAYLISRIGAETYHKRKSAENFIIQFPNNFSRSEALKPQPLLRADSEDASQDSPCIPLSTEVEINYFLHYMLLREASKKDGVISLILQSDYDFLFNLLPGLKPSGSLRIEQIICMSNADEMDENNELYNLNYLKRIVPLYIAGMDYHPYYFYENIRSHYYNLNVFPCLILTSDRAIVCTSDYNSGILFRDPSVVSMLRDLYYSYRNKSSTLFHLINFVPTSSEQFQSGFYQKTPSYILQPDACMTPFLRKEILDNTIIPQFAEEDNILGQLDALLSSYRRQLETDDMHIYFTKRGMLEFARSGRIKEIPDEFYRAFSPRERSSMMRDMLSCCAKGIYRILRRPLDHLTDNLHLCVNRTFGYLLFNNMEQHTLCLVIDEPSILGVFVDYLENLDESRFYSNEETVEFIEGIIRELEEKEAQGGGLL